MLRLQAQPAVPRVGDATRANEASIQVVAGVKLHPRLIGEHIHDAARRWLEHRGGERQFAAAVQNVVHVIAAGDSHLRMVGIDAFSQGARTTEVERRPGHHAISPVGMASSSAGV